MAGYLKQSTSATVVLGPFVDPADAVTEETGLTPAVELSKAGGAFASANTGTTAHLAEGYYDCDLDATDTNTLGRLVIKSHDSANHLPVWETFTVLPANVYDALIAGSDSLEVDTTLIEGTDATDQLTTYGGATAAQVWANATRTLTQGAASVTAAVSGSDVSVYQAATWTIALTGLGSIATRTMLWFVVKSVRNDPDSDAVVMIEETAGLQYVAGAAAGTSGDGSITVDDQAAGDITITLKPASSALVTDGTTYHYGVKVLTSAGAISQLTEGSITVKPALPLATS